METAIVERVNLFLGAKHIQKSKIAQELGWEKKTIYNQLNGACDISIELIVGIRKLYPTLNLDYVLLGEGSMEGPISNTAQKQIDELNIKIRERDAQIKLLKQLVKN